MAKLEMTAFVEDVVRGQDGGVFVLKTAETHSKKDENGKYQTVARTFRDVKVSRGSGINLDAFAKGERITVAGVEKTEVRQGSDGKKYYSLVVWADSITGGNAPAQAAGDAWYDDSQTPF